MEKEKEKKENGNKIRQTEDKQERVLKVAQHRMDMIRGRALQAQEKAQKANAVHKEAKLKRRQYRATALKKESKGKELYSKAAYAKAQAGSADKESLAAQSEYHHATRLAEANFREADWSNHQKAKQQAATTGRITPGWLQLKNTVGDMIVPDPETKKALHSDAQDDKVVPDALALETHIKAEHGTAEETELYATPWTQGLVPFADNFANGVMSEGLKPPPMADELNVLGAAQATAGADSAQLGTAPPAATQGLAPPPPGNPAIVPHYQAPLAAPPQAKSSSSTAWGWIIFAIILLVLVIIIAICCFFRNSDRFKKRPVYSPPSDYGGQPHPVYGQSDYGQSGAGLSGLSGSFGETGAAMSMPRDPRRAEQIAIVMRELSAANAEMEQAPWFKRNAIQARIEELLKWKSKLEDETRPLYATATDRTSAFPLRDNISQQRNVAAGAFGNGMTNYQTQFGQPYPVGSQGSPAYQQYQQTMPQQTMSQPQQQGYVGEPPRGQITNLGPPQL